VQIEWQKARGQEFKERDPNRKWMMIISEEKHTSVNVNFKDNKDDSYSI